MHARQPAHNSGARRFANRVFLRALKWEPQLKITPKTKVALPSVPMRLSGLANVIFSSQPDSTVSGLIDSPIWLEP